MEIFLTILAGAGTFVLGQIIIKLIIEPVQVLKGTIAEVADKLIFFANIYGNPRSIHDEKQAAMSSEIRILTSKLQAGIYLIPAYNITARIFSLPKKDQVVEASEHLFSIHNGHDGALENQGILNCYSAQNARIALGIHIPKTDYLNPEREAMFITAKRN